eukprot:scaffold61771_cov40-Prasinocladus_malaysianus.AAC.2
MDHSGSTKYLQPIHRPKARSPHIISGPVFGPVSQEHMRRHYQATMDCTSFYKTRSLPMKQYRCVRLPCNLKFANWLDPTYFSGQRDISCTRLHAAV